MPLSTQQLPNHLLREHCDALGGVSSLSLLEAAYKQHLVQQLHVDIERYGDRREVPVPLHAVVDEWPLLQQGVSGVNLVPTPGLVQPLPFLQTFQGFRWSVMQELFFVVFVLCVPTEVLTRRLLVVLKLDVQTQRRTGRQR